MELALENSLVETQNANASIGDIEQMKTFYPTEEEFSMGPCAYAEHIIGTQNARSYALTNLLPDQVLCYYATFLLRWAKLVTNTVEVGEDMERLTIDKNRNSCQCSDQNKSKKDEF